MEYRTLRGTGAKVSRFCLGTMTFGGQVDEAESIRMIHTALEAGVNFIDTADVYNKGLTETIVGKALRGKRDDVVLVSKVRGLVEGNPLRNQGLARWHILRGVEASLKRLQTDCLDILLLHQPDYETPIEESLEACDDLVRQGKIIYYGMSNYAAWQICQAKWLAERKALRASVVGQHPYNLITRSAEAELVPFLREMQVGWMVYNPLAGGLLTGKHDPSRPPTAGTRFDLNQEYYKRYWQEDNFNALAELHGIARQAGISMVQLAFRWLLSQEIVDAIIGGATRLEQLTENIAACEGRLEAGILAACDQVWKKIRGGTFQYNR